jgi:gliding motility-associated-like protein
VEVYNRWGGKLFESDGYANPWDGTYKGDKLPIGAYYFVVDFNDGVSDPIKGTVTIIR